MTDAVGHLLDRLESLRHLGSGWVARCSLHENRVGIGIRFPSWRVRFWPPGRESTPRQGQAVLYAGSALEDLRAECMASGTILGRWPHPGWATLRNQSASPVA